MPDPKEEKKSIFDRAVDAVSSRDEKAAAEKAAAEVNALKSSLAQEQTLRRQAEQKAAAAEQKAAAAEQKTAAVQKELDTTRQALASAQQAANSTKTTASAAEAKAGAAQSRLAAAEARVKQLEEQVRQLQEAEAQRQAAAEVAKTARKHKVAPGETLSGIALKYYGSAAREKWMIIYEANQATIGDNPNLIRAGSELIIP